MKAGWQKKKLYEVCELVNGRAYSKPELLTQGKYRVLRVGNFFTNDHWYYSDLELDEKKYCDSGDLLYAWSASFGPRIWSGEKVIFHYHIWKVLPDYTLIDKKFLFLWFLWDTEQIKEDQGAGTTMMHVSKGSMDDRDMLLPPLPEQQRIVGILDEAFDGITTAKANAEQNLQNARALFESHLQSVFTQRGEGWVDRQLATVCHEITVGHVGPMKTQYKENGVPFLRSQNIRPFEVSMENAMFIDETFHRVLKKSRLRPGDLAIVRTGYPGTAAVIPPELPDANCSDLVIVRPSEEVNPHFLAAFFNSAFGKELVLGKIVGAAQKHFNVTAAKEVMLHVPPMPEQSAIIAKVDALREETQRLESLYQRKLAALDELKKSLLHQAFSGAL
jgi:type I restriction enzyme S subunit